MLMPLLELFRAFVWIVIDRRVSYGVINRSVQINNKLMLGIVEIVFLE